MSASIRAQPHRPIELVEDVAGRKPQATFWLKEAQQDDSRRDNRRLSHDAVFSWRA
jgi:hypothetical protein